MKKILFLFIVFISVLIINVSCDSQVGLIEDGNIMEINREDIKLTSNETETTHKLNDFTLKLLKSAYISEPMGNVMISPLSTSMVLGMMVNAIEPEEREEVLTTLGLDDYSFDDFNSLSKKLLEQMPDLDPSARFSLNNSLWLTNDATLSDLYRNLIGDEYQAPVFRFDGCIDQAVIADINDWVSKNTNAGIKDLLKPEDALLQLQLAWLNVLYFKGKWTQKFDESLTEKKSFYPLYPETSGEKKIDMMHGANFRYAFSYLPDGAKNQADCINTAMLPYGNESFVFIGILPPENNPDMMTTLGSLTADYWDKVNTFLSFQYDEPRDIVISLPKMNLDKETNLIPILSAVGLNNIFEAVSFKSSLTLDNQRIALFRQRTLLDLNEEGTEIKVATTAGGTLANSGMVYNFNRPFIYLVIERSTGTALLAGIYQIPEN